MEKDRTPSTISTVSVPVLEDEKHERAKEPLPVRPPRKHPQGAVRILGRFPAAHPRGSWPAEEFANAQTTASTPATVVMNLATDEYLVKAVA